MEDSLFRKVSTERLSSPEQIDQLMKIRTTSGWLILFAVLIMLGVGVGWLVLGKIPVTIPCSGSIMPVKGLTEVQASKSFVIDEVFVHSGFQISKNDVLLKGKLTETEEEYFIKAPYDGIITDIYVDEGNVALQGKTLVRIEPLIKSGVNDLCAIMYISIDNSVKLKGGEEVFVSPSSISLDSYGYIRGKVETVSRYSDGNEQGIAIRIKFVPSKDGNFDYTYGRLPDETPKGGTPCSGYIQLGYEKPIEMLLPWLVAKE